MPLAKIFLLLVATACSSKGQKLETCSVRRDPFTQSVASYSLGATFYIDLHNPFTCYGIIRTWRFCYQKSGGAIFNTIYIGVYAQEDNGNKFVKKGENSIYFSHLKDHDCVNITADPQLIVNKGYYIAYYSSLIYIQLYNDPTNGYIYKSVAFPNSISKGVLIKTTHPLAPFLTAYIDELEPLPPITISTGAIVPTPSPQPVPFNSSSGIPLPDLESRQCIVGIDQGFANQFKTHEGVYLNRLQPSECEGIVQRWEFCHRYIDVAELSIHLGIWRLGSDNITYDFVGGEEVTLEPDVIIDTDPLRCTSVETSNITYKVMLGDLIGFNASSIYMAFNRTSSKLAKRDGQENIVPLMRAIVDMLPSGTSINTASPTMTTKPSKNALAGNIVGSIVGLAIAIFIVVLVIILCLYVANRKAHIHRLHTAGMIYNVNYIPSKAKAEIFKRRNIHDNSDPLPSPPFESDKFGLTDSEHIYESL